MQAALEVDLGVGWVWHPDLDARAEVAIHGGKAWGLAALEAAALPVPPWYVVTADAFRAVLRQSSLGERIATILDALPAASGEAMREAAATIRDGFEALELPTELTAALAACHRERIPGDQRLAVRSSATDEDGAGSSFAGLYDTVLGVGDSAAVAAALRRVWASAFSAAALGYRHQRGLSTDGAAMAVIVQGMVEARASGVLFTVDPIRGDVHKVILSALYGLGEGLVGEGLAADRYTVDKTTLAVTSEIVDKAEQMQAHADRGLVREPVAEGLRQRSTLDESAVLTLARAGITLEQRLGRPQDVEFAVDGAGQILYLQTRPVTQLEEYGPAAGHRQVWDHENWAENYPGVCLPMTFSVARRLEEVQYGCFAEMMRIDPRVAEEHRATLGTSLGLIRGRLVTDGVQRYRLLSLIPGINFQRRAFLSLLSVLPEEIDPEVEAQAPTDWRTRYLRELPALLRLFLGLSGDLRRVDGEVEALLAAARRFHARALAMDFATAPPHAMVGLYEEVESRLLTRWTAPMRNVFLLRLLYVLLKSRCRAWCGDKDDSLVNELMRGEEGAESARPVKELMALATRAHADPALLDLFRRLSPQELARRLPGDPRFADFDAAFRRYLDTFYFKSLFEMKLEAETLRDRPEILYSMVRGHLLNDDPQRFDLEALAARDREARERAEKTAFGAFRWKPWKLPQRLFFGWLLRRVRRLDGYREEVKFLRLQLMGTFRELIRGWGGWLAREGITDDPRDVFYLSLGEVLSYFRGRAVTTDLRGLVALRRREWESWEGEESPDDHFITYGVPYHKNRYRRRPEAGLEAEDAEGGPDDGADLRGTGCCHGVVEGAVRVLHSPLETAALSGEILVTERLHGGWLHLLSTASGVLVERGEILSHAATVARELGVPTIVGIPGLLGAVESGQRVSMDGARGTVTFL